MTPAEMLAFEARPWVRAGAKERAITDTFGVSPIRYYQQLAKVIDDPASLAIDATTVRRLQRLRSDRASLRARRSA